ncbi:DNA-processing protein DprA [Polynucleobacter sp. UK-Mo-2m-Kol15]|uniref:DNA-processing protein DprA n=1 Tax=Polynucleobacter sp. UK-Mo-2m-Kol15 TaxID=2576916 RepID=UPI001C0AE2B3|nr:DNA-processing protein DprA [Polynucleobacter sp. UK-Mo-2m-Kol15]MBU3574453.1 DNA-protecting protein DprA [Polynucleobacter sp. UK-Mo-2m-Kol15]
MDTLKSPHIIQLRRSAPGYPVRLLDLFDPPNPLYVYGDIGLLNLPMIAIVGSRAASPEGIKNASDFAQALSAEGYLVISGLARGIDGAAHLGALGPNQSHPTLAVCGTGLDIVYPREHLALAQSIGGTGLLVSELAPGMGPKACHFPRRNRIIAALALGILVIEAAERSGSLITARLGSELGREIFAIPGSIHHPLSRGCHQLIQQGAKLVQSPKDVLEELPKWSKPHLKPFKALF